MGRNHNQRNDQMNILGIFLRLVTGKKLPEIQNTTLPPEDSFDEIAPHHGKKIVGGESVVLHYRDARGKVSVRRITINGVEENYIKCYCHERKAPRNFKIDRIISVADFDGEIFDNFEEMFSVQDNPKKFKIIWDKISPEIILLRAIARADGRICKEETEVIIDYAISRFKDSRHLVSKKDIKLIKYKIKGMYPKELEIEYATPLMDQPTDGELINFFDCCEAVIKADGKILDSETNLYDQIKDAVLEYKVTGNINP